MWFSENKLWINLAWSNLHNCLVYSKWNKFLLATAQCKWLELMSRLISLAQSSFPAPTWNKSSGLVMWEYQCQFWIIAKAALLALLLLSHYAKMFYKTALVPQNRINYQ